ncbi:MAG: hypothetical protein ACI38Q_05075 [Candidatus Bruticola sp.]
MEKIRYWRRESIDALLAADSRIDYCAGNKVWGTGGLLLLGFAILATILFFRGNISSMYDLPGGRFAEVAYWQQSICQKRCQAVGQVGGLKRKIFYVLSGERVGAPKVGEFKQFATFERQDSDFYYWYTHRGSPWVNNLLMGPALNILGRRWTNVVFIVGVLFSSGGAAVWLLKTLERSGPGVAVGTLVFMFNPLTLSALQALNWGWAWLAGLAVGVTLAIKMWRRQSVSWLQLSLVLTVSAFFCGYYALLLLAIWGAIFGVVYVSQREIVSLRRDYIWIAAILTALSFYLIFASCPSLSLRWTGHNPRTFWAVGSILVMWWGFTWAISSNDSVRGGKIGVGIFLVFLLLSLTGKAGLLVGGLIFAFGSSILLSAVPENSLRRSPEKATAVAAMMLVVFGLLLEWGRFSPLGGLNSNLAPIYSVLSGLEEFKNKKILELPFVDQPLYLFAQSEHGMPLVSRSDLLAGIEQAPPGYAEFCRVLCKLGKRGINEKQEIAALLNDKNMREEAWTELRKRGICLINLHERGCAHVELKSGPLSGSVFFRDYLVLYNLLGMPVVDDFEPISKGRWGWPTPDKREIAWSRMAVFAVPQAEEEKNITNR